MKFNITKKPEYSRGKWRLTDEFGDDIYMPQTVESSDGAYRVNMPVCKDTQSDLIQHILELFAKALATIEQLNAEKKGGEA